MSDPIDPAAAEASRAEYVRRVNRVIDHIESNLERPLSLAELAKVAHFSPFHFHRVFAGVVGETLSQFVSRLRLERAANLLKARPNESITSIAYACGYSGSATFARAFKDAFGVTATAFRDGVQSKIRKQHRNLGMQLGKDGEAAPTLRGYIDSQTGHPTWEYTMSENTKPENTKNLGAKIEVKDLPERHVAYLRHVGPYGQADVVRRLVHELHTWATPRGLLKEDTLHLFVPHDNPNLTSQDKLRLSVCIEIPEEQAVDGKVGKMSVAGGKFAVGRFDIEPSQIAQAWGVMAGHWLPGSGYQPDDRLCYETVISASDQPPLGRVELDICIPVRPL